MCEILWYGERGIINALVTELRGRDIHAATQFLEAIVWADGQNREWINNIQSLTFLVEIGLAEFGSPDLILVCRTSDEKTFVVFVEVKVVPYAASAIPNRLGMVPGYNSRINGQLSLKYRFSHALSVWPGRMGMLAEPAGLYSAYLQPPQLGGLSDARSSPRHLARQNVLQILGDFELHDLPIERCHFVAWTHDYMPFWEQRLVLEERLLPLFLFPLPLNANNVNELRPEAAWDATRSRVGWIGYGQIHETLRPGADYQKAIRTMFNTPVSRSELPQPSLENIHTINLREFSQVMNDRLGEIAHAARSQFGSRALVARPGSTSIKNGARVIIKLVPQDPNGPDQHILLGISHVLAPRDWCEPIPEKLVRIGGQPFYVLRLNLQPEGSALGTAIAIFEQVAERL
jgi:hypothetical protein